MSSITALPFSAWPTGRKVAAGVFALGSYVALAVRGGLPGRRAVPGAQQGQPAAGALGQHRALLAAVCR